MGRNVGMKRFVAARSEEDAPALVVANSAHEILFATPTARAWLRRFFRSDERADILPPRVSRWLDRRTSTTAAEVRARSKGASLFVRKYAPQPGECTALLLQLTDETAQHSAPRGGLSRRQHDVLR